ncbi:UpxY family transcription antiterminator [Flavobacterium agrisoli]|uniref:UpxY family transcription antiterminator n=1 Tax=Flavobacterium agrisoli TaxID=2793066 RepID=A0A934PPX8_9FLAO|nr:UpxY family transcription antiterminator [Flavobacterium agrisoli]MBK0370910.1 UpxY family transcription antiterminator [Flavobacterium agrisoli]
MSWYVIYTKPKWEKKVAEQLSTLGVESYCPVVMQVRQWSDRKKKVEIPLFNSYVFVRLDEKERDLVFQVQGVVRYLFWLGKPAVVRDVEIESIQERLRDSLPKQIEVLSHQKGDRIVLKEGVFANQEAIVKSVSKKEYVLELESLGCVLRIRY